MRKEGRFNVDIHTKSCDCTSDSGFEDCGNCKGRLWKDTNTGVESLLYV